MKTQLASQGLEPVPTSQDAFARQMRAEIEKWGKVVRATGAKPE
jgi:tripartite-type tricarboxylate transporter receptor subunit TctC